MVCILDIIETSFKKFHVYMFFDITVLITIVRPT